jgi:hypothetical protein
MTLAINLDARKSNLALGVESTYEPLDLFNDFLPLSTFTQSYMLPYSV